MAEREKEYIFKVIERYLFHKNYHSDNEETMKAAQTMIDIDITEMWFLTQD